MTVFLRFLMTVAANFAWQRIGGRGAIPPVKLPRSKQPMNLPILAPWQMMVGMWMLRKFWGRYGTQVKDKFDSAAHPAARTVGSWIPTNLNLDPKMASANGADPANLQTGAPAPRVWTTTAQPATANGPMTATPDKRDCAKPDLDKRDYGTRKLDDDTQ